MQSGRAILKLNPQCNGVSSLDGLASFSHCWLIFVFHANTNAHKDTSSFKAKIRPPRMKGKSVGVFATRSPHRPNNIGLSTACIESVKNGCLLLSSIDLIDGTPILDVKPYVVGYDRLALSSIRSADWINAEDPISSLTRRPVQFTPKALQQLQHFYSHMPKSHSGALFPLSDEKKNNSVDTETETGTDTDRSNSHALLGLPRISKNQLAKLRSSSFYSSAADSQRFISEVIQYEIRSLYRSGAAKRHSVAVDVFSIEFQISEDGRDVLVLAVFQ